LQQHQYKTHLF